MASRAVVGQMGSSRSPIRPITAGMRDEVLTVDCPRCGTNFRSLLQVDRYTLETMHVDRMIEMCPSCYRASHFDRSDYNIHDDRDGSAK